MPLLLLHWLLLSLLLSVLVTFYIVSPLLASLLLCFASCFAFFSSAFYANFPFLFVARKRMSPTRLGSLKKKIDIAKIQPNWSQLEWLMVGFPRHFSPLSLSLCPPWDVLPTVSGRVLLASIFKHFFFIYFYFLFCCLQRRQVSNRGDSVDRGGSAGFKIRVSAVMNWDTLTKGEWQKRKRELQLFDKWSQFTHCKWSYCTFRKIC